ncbi:MAG: porin family protein [Oceanicaulis sp.]
MRTLLLASIAAVAAASAASAQTPGSGYAGVGYTALDGEGATLGAITLRGGFDFTEYFGAEGDLHIGVVDDTVTEMGTSVDLSADFGAAVYGVARLPLGDGMSNIFARAGYATLEVEGSAMGVSVSAELDGFAYGVGGEFYFAGPNGVRLDYTRFDGDDGELDAFGISYIRRF